jgi:L-methionine (R)-S-oxide reductase
MSEFTLVADKTGDLRMMAAQKRARYRELEEQLASVLEGEDDLLAGMTSVVCLLHNAFPYFYWTGFYRRVAPTELLIGPYQGTLGCLRISYDRGVCGAAARERRTVIVPDVHLFPGHIACDALSASEIVVPLLDDSGDLLAVLDVDSTIRDAFDEVDAEGLERILAMIRTLAPGPLVAAPGSG